MLLRSCILAAAFFAILQTHSQTNVTGKPFTRSIKGATGDLITVVDGVFLKDGRPLLYIEEGLTHKVVRLDAQLVPSEEVVLKDVMLDGLKWNGVAPIAQGATMNCLLVSTGKKGAEYGIGTISTDGGLALTGFRRITSFEQAYSTDPTHTLAHRPQPDPILFSAGLAYAQDERIIRSADGSRYLLNHYTHNGRGNKRFFFACLGSDLNMQWSGSAELPYLDLNSAIHQISLADDGTIHLLTYVFPCKSDEQVSDKLCHELHFTTISDQGKTVKDVLLEKDFMASARFCEREGGRIALALRYGSLTGQPGVVATFDPADPKLKPTPLLDQRLPGIHKTKLMAYGNMDGDKKPISRTAKLPDEIVDILPAWDGGLLVVETYLDNAYQLPMGDMIAMRRLCGPVRVSYVASNDSIKWQKEIDRSFMTTAGQAYETVSINMDGSGVMLAYDHTPRGMTGILASGNAPQDEEKKGKMEGLAEPGVLKIARLDRSGAVVSEGTALSNEGGMLPCPMSLLLDGTGQRALVKSHDRGTTYTFSAIDPVKVGQ